MGLFKLVELVIGEMVGGFGDGGFGGGGFGDGGLVESRGREDNVLGTSYGGICRLAGGLKVES